MELNQSLHGRDPKERQEYLLALKLRTTPQFTEIVHRLDSGKTVWSVTDWFMQQKNRGSLGGCSFNTAYRYIGCLNRRLRKLVDGMDPNRVEELRHMTYHERMRLLRDVVEQNTPTPQPIQLSDMQRALTEEIEQLDAITAVKFCFSIQKDRVMLMRRLEDTAGIQFPFGNKHLDVLRLMAESLWKVQAGQAILRSKNSWPIHMGEADRVPIDLLPEVQAVMQLDPIDQNLIREAVDKTIDLLHQEAGLGQYSRRAKTDSGGAETKYSSGDK